MEASSSPSPTISTAPDLIKEIKRHEVAIAELSNIPSSRAVYQKHGNILFRTTLQKATAFEQRELETAKAMLQKLNSL